MLYQTSRHLWLQERGDQIVCSNVCTGRRAMLDAQDLEVLEGYREPTPLGDDPLSERLKAADLVVVPGKPVPNNPRLDAVLSALDRFLAERESTSRSRIRSRHPDPRERFDLCQRAVETVLTEHNPEFPATVAKDVAVMLNHVRTFYADDLAGDHGFCFEPGFLSATVGRPLPREDYEQQPCLPETSQRRVELADQRLPAGGRCLILGDDDLLSLYWALYRQTPCDVFELDQELIAFLKPTLDKTDHVRLYARDLTEGLPEEFQGDYDIVFTDPMYERTGMDLFLKCCSQGLSESPDARVLFTTRPDMIDDGEMLEQRLAEVGLTIVKVHRHFTRYPLPNFTRRLAVRGFHKHGLPAHLVDGLMQVPFLYADMFELKRAN